MSCLLRLGLSDSEATELGGGPALVAGESTPGIGADQPDPVFQHYRVLQREDGRLWELGRGAMGVTYKAIDTNLHAPVVLKVIGSQALQHPGARERFLHEARAAARLRHPNIASVFHLGQRGDDHFYAMEFIEGETVQDRIRRQGPIPVLEALAVAEQVVRALGTAHRQHLVHRDIKPSNLMLVRDTTAEAGGRAFVKVIDFGIVKYLVATGGETHAFSAAADLTGGGLVGTPSFASPEQLLSGEGEVDGRADFYSLGCTLWFMLLGWPPFGGDPFSVVGQHLNKQPPFQDLTQARVPAPVIALLRCLLKKDPADRPASAADLRARLELCAAAVGAAQAPTSLPPVAGSPAPAAASAPVAEGTRSDAAAETTATPAAPVPALADDAVARVPARGTTRLRTVALLLTNIEGSTAFWERAGAAFRDTLDRHHELLRAEFVRHEGEEINEVGDGFLVAFDEAAAALRCALAIQHMLGTAELWPQAQSPAAATGALRLRMALHVGTIERHGTQYRGLDLHRASRVLRAARGGQILCSTAAAGLLRRDLPAGCGLTDLGEYQLGGVVEGSGANERLFLLRYPGMGEMETRAVAAPVPHGFPTALTRFFGRENEIATLCHWLGGAGAPETAARSSATGGSARRLITLTGPGGTGKTRLALAVAERVTAGGDPRPCYLSLAEVSDPRLLADRLRDVFLRPGAGSAAAAPPPGVADLDALEQVVALLSTHPTLLVLDNFEHLAGEVAGEFLGTLLDRVPGLRCLVTSRQRLDLSGEWEFAVAPLPAPPAGGLATADDLDAYASVQLFCDRAQAARADFHLSDAIAPTVADLCRRLDGIPLAIELAAARVGLLTPRQIVTRLTHCLDVLVGGKKDAAARHRTLRATLDWSYEMLPSALRAFFARLAVFRGGWTAEAAAAIALEADGSTVTTIPASDAALEPLGELHRFSLILAEEGSGETMRYRMLEPLRQYAEEHLEKTSAAGEAARTRKRHRDYFVLLALRAEPELRKPEQGHWLMLLEAEHENFRAVLAATPEGDAVRLPLALALHRFWMLHGYVAEGRGWLERALNEDATRGGDIGATDPTRAKARNAAGVLAWSAGDLESARGHFGLALAHFRALGDVAGSARALNNLAIVASEQGDFDAARIRYEESLVIWRELRDVGEQALVLSNLGRVLLLGGDRATARARLEESLRLQRTSQDPFSLLNTFATLGEVEVAEGDFSAAYRHFESSVRIREEIGYKNNAALFWTLATLSRRNHEHDEACRFLSAAAACRRELGLELSAAEQERWDAEVAVCAGNLRMEKFAATWAEGKKMKLAQVLRILVKNQD